ncbi:hypothetical protein HWI79_2607, partial [Cryptosporidium felis]
LGGRPEHRLHLLLLPRDGREGPEGLQLRPGEGRPGDLRRPLSGREPPRALAAPRAPPPRAREPRPPGWPRLLRAGRRDLPPRQERPQRALRVLREALRPGLAGEGRGGAAPVGQVQRHQDPPPPRETGLSPQGQGLPLPVPQEV